MMKIIITLLFLLFSCAAVANDKDDYLANVNDHTNWRTNCEDDDCAIFMVMDYNKGPYGIMERVALGIHYNVKSKSVKSIGFFLPPGVDSEAGMLIGFLDAVGVRSEFKLVASDSGLIRLPISNCEQNYCQSVVPTEIKSEDNSKIDLLDELMTRNSVSLLFMRNDKAERVMLPVFKFKDEIEKLADKTISNTVNTSGTKRPVPEKQEKMRTIAEATFLESHDPGWMKLKLSNGKETSADFYYRFITYDEIKTWKEGEAVKIVLSSQNGLGIVRAANGKFYKIVTTGKENDLLQGLEDGCVKKATTTMGYAGCYRESSERWSVEQNYILNYLLDHTNGKLRESLKESQKQWKAYTKSESELYWMFASEQGGTIRIIEGAALRSGMVEERFNQLLLFLTISNFDIKTDSEEPGQYGAWQISSQDKIVRYISNGNVVHGHQFGFIKKENNCDQDLMWISWSGIEKGIERFKGVDAAIQFRVGETKFQLEIPLIATYQANPSKTVVAFSNFVAGEKLMSLLENEEQIELTIVSPEQLRKKFDVATDTFSLNGFASARLNSRNICENRK